MHLTPFGKPQWLTIIAAMLLGIIGCLFMHWWIVAIVVVLIGLALLSFFRDPHRNIPTPRGLMVSPSDGVVSSIHKVDQFPGFNDQPALCIRIFMSVLDVHVNRSPCHGRVASMQHKPGQYLNALKAESAELNESITLVLHHPARKVAIAAVRQIAGTIARRIVCATHTEDILQRGQRFGMIKFGSTTELYLPNPDKVVTMVEKGQRVYGGSTVLAQVASPSDFGPHAQPAAKDAEAESVAPADEAQQ